MDRKNRKRLLTAVAAIIAATLVLRCFFTVDEAEWGLVLRFGKPIRTLEEAGLYWKWPIDSVRRFDRRLQLYDPPPSEFLTGDKKNLVLDNFVCWKVADPVVLLQRVGDFTNAEMRLHDIVWAELSAAMGGYELGQIVSAEPGQVKIDELMDQVGDKCRALARENFGIEVVDIRLKRFNFPQQNKEAVFARMRTERERIAKQYRAEGEEEAMRIRAEADRERERLLAEAYREAEKTRGQGDAEAARIYAEAYSKDEDFYKLTRTLEAYKKAIDAKTTAVLSADSEFLRLLTRGRKEAEK